MNDITQPRYFDVLRALHRGGLSLWLNRKALIPLTLVPTVVAFLTLMFMRGAVPDDATPFLLALVQIPADFAVGLLSALIIFIIVSAPNKQDSDKPVMFTLNLNTQKKVFVSAALAHVVFSYFAGGVFGVMSMIYKPMEQAAQNEVPPSMGGLVLLFLTFFILVYGMRLMFLPILITARGDVKSFFRHNKAVGFSLPVFLLKLATTLPVGFAVLMLTAPFMVGAEGGSDSIPPVQLAFIDFITDFGSVIATAWMYAALSVGYRQMRDGAVQ